MSQASWSFGMSLGTVILASVCLLVAVAMCGRMVRRQRGSKRLLASELLRLVVVALLVVTLFRPEYVRRVRREERPLVAILCDRSGSMDTRDVRMPEGAITRASWLQEQCEEHFWAPLEAKYDVVVEDFSAAADDDEGTPPSADGTDINAAIEATMQRYSNLRALLLLSDGDWNTGRSPVSAATKLRMDGVPAFTVAVGSGRYLPDLELVSVAAPAYALVDEHVSLPFTIQSRLPHDVRTSIRLTGPGGFRAEKAIVIPAMTQFHDAIVVTPRLEGVQSFRLRLPLEEDELLRENNEQAFTIAFRREILKVLVIESAPRWEFRFLHNALSRDPGVVVHGLLMHPGMARAVGRNYISDFPGTKEELSQYDVVFLGDVGIGPEGLTEEQAVMIRGLVEHQGSGLVFLPGILGNQHSLLGSALEPLMPVQFDGARPRGFGFEIPARLALTSRGSDHLLTMLAHSPTENQHIWRRLPGFYWHAAVLRAKPGSDVLAVHANARNQHGRLPLLVTRNCKNGKVLFLGTDGAWRWRRGVEDTYHYRFWGQVVRWMSHQRHLAHDEGIRFFFSPESPQAGDTVFLHATVFGADGFPIKQGTVRATISLADGTTRQITLLPDAGGWGVFTGSFVASGGGEYRVTVACEEAGRSVETALVVAGKTIEQVGRPARESVLRELASISEGRSGTAAELESMVGELTLLPEPKAVETRFRLWCHPLWAGLIVMLLGLYWISRKLMGMI